MKKSKTKSLLACAVLLGVLGCGTAPLPVFASGIAKTTDIEGGKGGTAGNAGTIYFGKYWQSYKGSGDQTVLDNYNKEGIKWRVLANNTTKDGNGNKGLLLFSDQALYADAFNSDTSKGNQWGNSEIRATLNNVIPNSGFAGDAFSSKELAVIEETTHIAGGGGTGSDFESTEKIFLLNTVEAQGTNLNNNAPYGFPFMTGSSDERKAYPTEMAKNVSMYGNAYKSDTSYESTSWWLRSPTYPYEGVDCACNVRYDGEYYCDTVDGTSWFYSSVRPALNIDQDSVLFLSAAEGGKANVVVGDGFNLADYDGANGWKLTVYDKYDAENNPTGIKAPTDVTVTQKEKDLNAVAQSAGQGGTIDLTNGFESSYFAPEISYNAQAITDGTANFVSAVVVDESGNYVNYAKISDQASETDKGIKIDKLADGTYKMYVFAEQANGAKETDYASDFSNEDGYTVHKGVQTKYEGTLGEEYGTKGLTAKLGNNFKLCFEGTKYDTKVNVEDGNASLIADNVALEIAEMNVKAGQKVSVEGFVNAKSASLETGASITSNGLFVSDKYVAIGNGSVVNEENTVSVGAEGAERKIVNVADGTADTDAATYGQVKNKADKSTTLAGYGITDAYTKSEVYTKTEIDTVISGTGREFRDLQRDVSGIHNQIDRMGTRINKVGAGAAALAAMHPVYDEDCKLTFSAGLGAYRSEKAAAVGMFYRFSDRVMMNAGTAVGNDNNMFNIGLNFALDRHVGTKLPSKAVMARELMALREKTAEQDAKIAKLTAMLEALLEKKGN